MSRATAEDVVVSAVSVAAGTPVTGEAAPSQWRGGDLPPLRVSSMPHSRYGAWPLLLWLFAQGLPLGRTLEPAKPALIEEVYARSIEMTSQASSLNSALLVGFLGTLYLGAALVVVMRLRLSATLMARHWPLPLLVLVVAASMTWSFNTEKVALNTVHNCGAVLIALAAALRYQCDPWRMPQDAGHALGLNLLLQIGAVAVLPSHAIDFEGRWTGLTGQANTLGALALCACWANIAAAFVRPRPRSDPASRHLPLLNARSASLAFSLLAAVAMAGANSVTSMLSAGCMLAATLRLKQGGGRLMSITVLLVVPVVTMLVVSLASVVNLSSVLGMAGRSGDFSGRTSIWADGVAVIARQPWLGWSFDDHAYVIRSTGMQYTTYHNGYLDLGVAGGLCAILLLTALLATAFLQLNRPRRIARTLRGCALPFMLAVLVYNTTEAAFMSPRNPIWMLFLTLTLLGAGQRHPGAAGARVVTLLRTRFPR